MNITELRNIFKSFLTQHLRIDKWGLGLPESMVDLKKPPSIATDKPASEMSVISIGGGYEDDRVITSVIVLPFTIIYRFDSSIRYTEIPLSEAEEYLKYVLDKIKNSDCFNESIKKIDPTGNVNIGEGTNGDRLIMMDIKLEIVYESLTEKIESLYFGA